MIGMIEGTVFIVLPTKVVKNHSSLGIKPVAPVAGCGTIKNHGRKPSIKMSGLGGKIDLYS